MPFYAPPGLSIQTEFIGNQWTDDKFSGSQTGKGRQRIRDKRYEVSLGAYFQTVHQLGLRKQYHLMLEGTPAGFSRMFPRQP